MTDKELTELASELENCGKALLGIAEAMKAPPDEQPAEPDTKELAKKVLTLEDVRKVAADKSRQGFTDEVRGLIQQYGADKLSGMDPAKYEAFLKELGVLGNAK